MATVSFDPANASAPVTTEDPKPQTTVATQQSAAITVPRESSSGIEGEVTSRDIRPPRLRLIQKTSQAADDFAAGSFLYSDGVLLADPKQVLSIVILRFKKYFQQKLVYGSEETPIRLDTIAEVRAHGGSTQWGAENYYEEAADMLLAIEQPEGITEDAEPYFCNEIGGKFYALALYSVSGTGYGSLGTKLITDASLLLKDGTWTGVYTLSRSLKKTAKNSWFVPTAQYKGKLAPEVAEVMKQLSGR